VNLTVAQTAIGKPLFKASEGGRVDILREREDTTRGEVEEVSRMYVPIWLKVRPCLRRSGFAQAGRSLSERLAHVWGVKIYAMLR